MAVVKLASIGGRPLGLPDWPRFQGRSKGGAKLGHCGGVKVDHLRRDDSLSKAAVSGAGTQSGDAW